MGRKIIEIQNISDEYKNLQSIRELSRKYNVSRPTVRKILIENGVKILSNDEAIQIANLKHPKIPFDNSDKEKAYLYGFVTGDVHVFKKSKFTLRAITHTTHKSFVDLFMNQFEKYGYVNCKYTKNDEWRLFIDLDYQSFKFLEERISKSIPSWIDDTNFIHFLSGLIDSDGSVIVRKSGKYFQYVIRLFGNNKEFLRNINNEFKRRGFRPSFYRNFKAGETRKWKDRIITYNKDYYVLEIYRKEESIRLLQSLLLKHKEKIDRRKLALSIYKRKLIKWEDVKEEMIRLRTRLKEEVQTRSN